MEVPIDLRLMAWTSGWDLAALTDHQYGALKAMNNALDAQELSPIQKACNLVWALDRDGIITITPGNIRALTSAPVDISNFDEVIDGYDNDVMLRLTPIAKATNSITFLEQIQAHVESVIDFPPPRRDAPLSLVEFLERFDFDGVAECLIDEELFDRNEALDSESESFRYQIEEARRIHPSLYDTQTSEIDVANADDQRFLANLIKMASDDETRKLSFHISNSSTGQTVRIDVDPATMPVVSTPDDFGFDEDEPIHVISLDLYSWFRSVAAQVGVDVATSQPWVGPSATHKAWEQDEIILGFSNNLNNEASIHSAIRHQMWKAFTPAESANYLGESREVKEIIRENLWDQYGVIPSEDGLPRTIFFRFSEREPIESALDSLSGFADSKGYELCLSLAEHDDEACFEVLASVRSRDGEFEHELVQGPEWSAVVENARVAIGDIPHFEEINVADPYDLLGFRVRKQGGLSPDF